MRRLAVSILTVLFTIYSPITEAKKPEKYIPYGDTIGWKLCQDKANFDCVLVKETGTKKKVPETWEDLFPNTATRELVQKLNRLNIVLKKDMPIAMPKDKNKTFADFSPFSEWIVAPKEKLIIFDPTLLAVAIYSPQGKLLRWMPAIGGRDRCLDTWRRCRTVVGEFKVTLKGDEKTRSHIYPIGCGSKKNPCALMAWFVGFYKRLYGFHASEMMEGKHASHGCVRLFLNDAEWLNKDFVEIGTRVIVRPYPTPLPKPKRKR